MGARPSSFKKSGGFLNGVDGVITAITFSDDVPAKGGGREPFTPGKVKDAAGKMKEKFHTLFAYLSVRPDGATEDVETSLFAGSADDFRIAEDGSEVWDAAYETPEEAEAAGDEARQLGANTALGKFIKSLVDSGFPETMLNETRITYVETVGTRCRFEQKTNADDTKRLGKRKDKKTGKEYDRQDLIISQVYELPSNEAEAAPAKSAKSAPVAKGKPVSKPNGKAGKPTPAPAEDEVDIEAESRETLLEILAAEKSHAIQKSKLSVKVLTLRTKHPQRDEIRKTIFDDDFLAGCEGVSYDKKSGVVSLDA